MAAVQLTRGAVATIAESKAWHNKSPVVLQVVDTPRIPPPSVELDPGMPKTWLGDYSLVLSDGVHTFEVYLITPLRQRLVRDGRVRKGSVVRLLSYCTIFSPIIFKLEVLQVKAALIGSPVPYESGCNGDEPDVRGAAGDAAPSGGSCSSGQGTSSSSARRV